MRNLLSIGDKVLVSNSAFDEQFERMENTSTIYTISDLKYVNLHESKTEWVKIKGGVKLIEHNSEEVRYDTDWIDRLWIRKI